MAAEKAFFDAGGYDFLLALEDRYSCASICLVPLFYLTKDVADGPPVNDCFTAAVEDITDNKPWAFVFVISGILHLFAIFGAFTLSFKDEEEQAFVNNRSRKY